MNTEYLKMINGELYNAQDAHLKKLRRDARVIVDAFNSMPFSDELEANKLLKSLFKAMGTNSRIKKPVYFDYGINIYLGDNFYANYDCIFLDVAPIVIGHNVMLGPRVSLFTATHPVDVKTRNSGLEGGKPIVIGNNVWIGGNTVINPGVTIGDNTVIGAGSVVTKNIPPNVIAVGNPCRVLRKITELKTVNHI